MNFDPVKLFFILTGTFIFGSVAWFMARGCAQRLMLLILLGGLVFYSGIGSAEVEVDPIFIGDYFALFVSIIAGFFLALPMFFTFGVKIGRMAPSVLYVLERKGVWHSVIVVYVLVSAFPLIWPEFKLHHLLSPPSPDLLTIFYQRFSGEAPDLLSRILEYVRLLMTPFFFTALYVLRSRFKWIVTIFLLLLYMDYVEKAAIGRGTVMMHIGYIILSIWFLRPRYRKYVIAVGLLLTPFIFLGLHWYSVIRIGGEFSGTGFRDAMETVLKTELGFVKSVGQPILETQARTDAMKYLIWIVTLPIPKILSGPIEGARVNYEISETVLGLPVGSYGWYVVLPGIVAESIYIFGQWLFWIHGVFIGIIAAFFARVMERVPQFLFLYIYIVIMFGYVLNRGGIAALLPNIINEFLFFYLFLFVILLSRRSYRNSAVAIPLRGPRICR